jgi:hypothetical protein
MKRLCDVPDCPRDGTEEVNDGFMCHWHAIQWDKANARSDIAPPEMYATAEDAIDPDVFAEGHARWLGSKR